MASNAEAEAPADSETALRWIPADKNQWDDTKRTTTYAVFRLPRGLCSLWIEERLPGAPDDVLHKPPRERRGRIALNVGQIRSQVITTSGTPRHLTIAMSPTEVPADLLEAKDAHANASGYTGGPLTRAEAGALQRLVDANLPQSIQRAPVLD